MLKLHASYGKKIPVLGTDYSSHSYQAEIEVEIPHGLASSEIQERIHRTFELVRRSVDAEFDRPGEVQPDNAANPSGKTGFPPQTHGNNGDRGRPDTPATPKQLKFLVDIAARKKITMASLSSEIRRRYGVGDPEGLSRRQASELLDDLNENSRGQGRAA